MFSVRALQSSDAPLMLEWMHDKDVTQFLSANFADKTLEDALQFIEYSNSINCKDVHMACVNVKNEYLGTVSLKSVDQENKRAEYAICMRKIAHGTGAALYATNEILNVAFNKLSLERVYLYHYASNIRAEHFYAKAGFIKEGVLRHHIFRNNSFDDEIWYGILRSEWCKRASS